MDGAAPHRTLSVIIPCLDEAGVVGPLLASLQSLRRAGHEVILVDGGSVDGTDRLAAPLVDLLLASAPGRARQMNAGARAAGGDILWFLHADTGLPQDAAGAVLEGLSAPGAVWGRFDVRLSGDHPLLGLVARMMNLRSRWSGIATGDQGIFVSRRAFEAAGGFPDIPLMEDIALSRRLKRMARPLCLRQRLTTSSRRWEANGVLRTIGLMWLLRLAFALGASPARLAKWY
ncbi:MAG TPA: glycosyltransferase [Sedimenticola sp.]|nr:glycosyltransferase [Sedimenticola sp.]